MKIQIKAKDALIIREFLGKTSTLSVSEFCETNDLGDGRKIDNSLYRLYKALGLRLHKPVESL